MVDSSLRAIKFSETIALNLASGLWRILAFKYFRFFP